MFPGFKTAATLLIFILGVSNALGSTMTTPLSNTHASDTKKIIGNFIYDIRAGHNLNRVSDYMAPKVIAHQVWAEGGQAVVRSPEDYRRHIEEFQRAFGPFTITIEEIIQENDRVFVRWRQDGFHNQSLAGEAPTRLPITEVTSTVYRLEDGKIVEYWLQTDRQGIVNQLSKIKEH